MNAKTQLSWACEQQEYEAIENGPNTSKLCTTEDSCLWLPLWKEGRVPEVRDREPKLWACGSWCAPLGEKKEVQVATHPTILQSADKPESGLFSG